MNEIKRIYGGLLPTKKEDQRFSFGATFGYIDPKDLPTEFYLGDPISIKNQGNSFACVAYSLCSVSEYQEGVELEPAFTIKTISEIEGDPNWVFKGTTLKNGAKAALKGFLSRQDSPYSVLNDGMDKVADPQTWSASYADLALKHAKEDFYWIGTSGGSMWDKIRSAMYQFKDEKRAVQTGLIWNNGWTSETFIDKEDTQAGGHAIAIIGWKDDYLILQNSIGKEIGQNGLQFLHKDLVNKLLTFGTLMFKDRPENETEESILKKSEYYRSSFISKLLLLLKKWFQDIFK